ncbi:hypothetical protein SAMN04488568_101241 [Maricaulis salignorans]|uniref:Uncharacterized protein n=2 Tax=Maricaulis salignorans TaxID=144026 RepID=A0A1G9LYJ2_9PROT|nr:hypothetical protein SAMN04488568_101241 [Maricaulis salignorans]
MDDGQPGLWPGGLDVFPWDAPQPVAADPVAANLVASDLPLFAPMPELAQEVRRLWQERGDASLAADNDASFAMIAEPSPLHTPAPDIDGVELTGIDLGLAGLVDDGALFDFSDYLERHEQRIEAIGRVDGPDLFAGDTATAIDANGHSVPLALLLEHVEANSPGDNAVALSREFAPEGVELGGLANDGAPIDFGGYLEMSNQCLGALAQAEGMDRFAAKDAMLTPADDYSVQLTLLLDAPGHAASLPDYGAAALHDGLEIPSAAEFTGLDWLSQDVMDTFGFDYALF